MRPQALGSWANLVFPIHQNFQSHIKELNFATQSQHNGKQTLTKVHVVDLYNLHEKYVLLPPYLIIIITLMQGHCLEQILI